MSEAASGDARRHTDGKVEAIFRSLARDSRTAFVTAGHTVSWADWLGSVEQLAKNYAAMRRSRVGVLMRASEKSYALLVGLSLLECDVFLLDERATSEEIEEIALSNHLAQTIDPLDTDGLPKPRLAVQTRPTSISRGHGSRFSLPVAAAAPNQSSTAGVL